MKTNKPTIIGLLCLFLSVGAVSADSIVGSAGDDAITGTAASDEIYGLDGDDHLSGGDGNDELRGGSGNDELRGGAGADQLRGGPGDDVLAGGAGLDVLFGGPGADKFVIGPLFDIPDLLKDFSPEEGDSIWLNLDSTSREEYSFPKNLSAGNIDLDFKGDLKIRLLNDRWLEIAKLGRDDLVVHVSGLGNEVRLTFSRTF